MSDGYAHTTISARPGGPARVGVSFYLDDRAWIDVPGIDAGRPHLHISHGDVSVQICPVPGNGVTAEDARIARDLADHAARYAAEIERLAAEHEDDMRSDPEAGGSAA